MFGNLQFITIFDKFILPNQVDISAHCSYHFLTSNVRRLRCNSYGDFSDKISSLANLMKTPLSKVAFDDQNTFLIRHLHF